MEETVLPDAEQAVASVAEEPKEEVKAEQTEEKKAEDKPAKPEKTPEQKEIERQRRRIDNLTRRLYEQRAQLESSRGSVAKSDDAADNADKSESEELTLSRAELQKLIDQRAKEIAPTIKQQEAEIEHRRKVLEKLSETWGQERFDSLASDLDDAFGGLADRSGKPKPATDAIFESDDPAALIEYLADPENAAQAEAIARMNPVQAGRAITKLEIQLEAEKAKAKAEEKPQRSKAPAPLEPLKPGGTFKGAPDPSDTKAWIRWRNEQEGGR